MLMNYQAAIMKPYFDAGLKRVSTVAMQNTSKSSLNHGGDIQVYARNILTNRTYMHYMYLYKFQ